MIQGTVDNAAHRIAKNGFGTVGSLDAGYYGQGIYFTSRVSYANKYAKLTNENRVFLIALVVPGNAHPITENPFLKMTDDMKKPEANPKGFLGKPCTSGYQSHFTVVCKEDVRIAFPAQGPVDHRLHADELVVPDASQVLPLFVVYSKYPKELGEIGSPAHLPPRLLSKDSDFLSSESEVLASSSSTDLGLRRTSRAGHVAEEWPPRGEWTLD